MNRLWLTACLTLISAGELSAAETPKAFVSGLANPESVCIGPHDQLYVTEIGKPGQAGDGKVSQIKDGQAHPFATGLNDPKGIVFHDGALYLTDVEHVVKVDAEGKTTVFAAKDAFPTPPVFLNDIAVDSAQKILLVSDSGDRKGHAGAVYRIHLESKKIDTLASPETIHGLHTPNGVICDGPDHFIVADMNAGKLYRVRIVDRSAQEIAEGLDGADGLVWDTQDRLFITSWRTGKTFAIYHRGKQPVLIGEGLQSAADCCLSQDGRDLLIPDMKAGTLTRLEIPAEAK